MKRNLYHDTLAHCPPKDLCPASHLGIVTIMSALLAQEVYAVEELFPLARSSASMLPMESVDPILRKQLFSLARSSPHAHTAQGNATKSHLRRGLR